MAWIAGIEPWPARCLREKRARKRRARGSHSEVRVLRRARIVASREGKVGECAIFVFVERLTLESISLGCFEPRIYQSEGIAGQQKFA